MRFRARFKRRSCASSPSGPKSEIGLPSSTLVNDAFCYRFRTAAPLGEAEGAFTVCGYWLAMSYLALGRELQAVRWFERARTACGPPGLYSEEYDVGQREMRGNLPQACVHAFLLETSSRLGKRLGPEEIR